MSDVERRSPPSTERSRLRAQPTSSGRSEDRRSVGTSRDRTVYPPSVARKRASGVVDQGANCSRRRSGVPQLPEIHSAASSQFVNVNGEQWIAGADGRSDTALLAALRKSDTAFVASGHLSRGLDASPRGGLCQQCCAGKCHQHNRLTPLLRRSGGIAPMPCADEDRAFGAHEMNHVDWLVRGRTGGLYLPFLSDEGCRACNDPCQSIAEESVLLLPAAS